MASPDTVPQALLHNLKHNQVLHQHNLILTVRFHELPAIAPAVDRFAARLEALAAKGVDVGNLAFEASHGRTALEYYDGFVFSFHAEGMPAVATGGRYDALTAVLGAGRSIPAVGGIIRPHLVAALRGAI